MVRDDLVDYVVGCRARKPRGHQEQVGGQRREAAQPAQASLDHRDGGGPQRPSCRRGPGAAGKGPSSRQRGLRAAKSSHAYVASHPKTAGVKHAASRKSSRRSATTNAKGQAIFRHVAPGKYKAVAPRTVMGADTPGCRTEGARVEHVTIHLVHHRGSGAGAASLGRSARGGHTQSRGHTQTRRGLQAGAGGKKVT